MAIRNSISIQPWKAGLTSGAKHTFGTTQKDAHSESWLINETFSANVFIVHKQLDGCILKAKLYY